MKKIFEMVKENKEIFATAVGVTAVATGVVVGLKTKALEIKKEDGRFTVNCSGCPAVLTVGGSIYAVKNGIKVYKKYRK